MNSIGSEEEAFVTAPDNAEARRTRVEAGDVLLTITGSRIGRVAAVPTEFAGAYVSQHVAILRLRDSLLPTFLSYYLSFPDGGQRQIAGSQYGQTKPGLNFEQIRRFRIPRPSPDAQREFVARVIAVTDLQQYQEGSQAQLASLFTSLQHRAFRGEL